MIRIVAGSALLLSLAFVVGFVWARALRARPHHTRPLARRPYEAPQSHKSPWWV